MDQAPRPVVLTQARHIPGERWQAMGPGARLLARAALRVRLGEYAQAMGLVLVGEPVDLTVHVDGRCVEVMLVVEAKAAPRIL